MKILSLDSETVSFLQKRNLIRKFEKQKQLFEENPFHPGLNTEILEPRRFKIYSFRIDRKYRAIFIYRDENAIEILDVNNHYQK